MQVNYSTSTSYSPNFQRFVKIKGDPAGIKKLKKDFKLYSDDLNTIIRKKDHKSHILYVLTGETYDKFLDLIPKMEYRDLKHNLEKCLGLKPERMSFDEAKKCLDKGTFTL